MWLKLLLELIALVPATEQQVNAALSEIHSSDTTGTKVSSIATIVAVIAQEAGKVIDATGI